MQYYVDSHSVLQQQADQDSSGFGMLLQRTVKLTCVEKDLGEPTVGKAGRAGAVMVAFKLEIKSDGKALVRKASAAHHRPSPCTNGAMIEAIAKLMAQRRVR
ncbi:hypothetical protein ABIB82_007306 [Bradyrhizobium sp. i1.8.4]|uniref:hypothetical protein n=1 Tax=unclassified Bradyrhizobium TaxID=2631580 RepID=UPI003D18FF98